MINLIDDINKQTKKAAKETQWEPGYTVSGGNQEAKPDVDTVSPNLYSCSHPHTSSAPFSPPLWEQVSAHVGIRLANVIQPLLTVNGSCLSYRAGTTAPSLVRRIHNLQKCHTSQSSMAEGSSHPKSLVDSERWHNQTVLQENSLKHNPF